MAKFRHFLTELSARDMRRGIIVLCFYLIMYGLRSLQIRCASLSVGTA